MKTSEQVTPEEQIQNQRETIESLEKKIESLEKQVHKCLPDSGEYRPEWKPRNEGPPVKPTKETERLELIGADQDFIFGQLESIIRGGIGIPELSDYIPWIMFRDQITDNPKLKGFLSDDQFLYGLSVMNKVIDRLRVMWELNQQLTSEERKDITDTDFGSRYPDTEKAFYLKHWQTTSMILLGATAAENDYEDYKIHEVHTGFLKLKDAFDSLPLSAFKQQTDYAELKLHFDCILWCQRYFISQLKK